MSDFFQSSLITTLHDYGSVRAGSLENALQEATRQRQIGLVLPVTGDDLRAGPFAQIMRRLASINYIGTIVVTLNQLSTLEDYRLAKRICLPLGSRAHVLWIDGANIRSVYSTIKAMGFNLATAGKGLSVWTAFGYLLADPRVDVFVLHDCDIIDYDPLLLARLCLPMALPGLDFDFCKAYYARCSDRMYGRVVRLLITPLVRALVKLFGSDPFLGFLSSFRYPLAGEFAISAALARSVEIPGDWALEVGVLAEVFRKSALKNICQIDLCLLYDHKHQELSLDDPSKGLMRMAGDILAYIYRTIAPEGRMFNSEDFVRLKSTFLDNTQDAIGQYQADALVNALPFNRFEEESAAKGFAQQIVSVGERFLRGDSTKEYLPAWSKVLADMPELPRQLRIAAWEQDNHLARAGLLERLPISDSPLDQCQVPN